MTVHGAKGLEAPIVILADTTTMPKGPREPRMLSLPVANAAPGTPDRLVWAGRKADDPEPVATARAARGARGRGRAPPPALCGDDARGGPAGDRGLARREPHPAGLLVRARQRRAQARRGRGKPTAEGAVWRWRKGPDDGRSRARIRRRKRRTTLCRTGCTRRCRAETRAPRAIAPSLALGAAKADARRARARAHRAPAAAGAARAAAGAPRRGGARGISRAQRSRTASAIADEVLTLLDDPRFAALFAPGSRAEVPIVGILADGRQVSGQADRLAITANEVLIADYKSDRIVPRPH